MPNSATKSVAWIEGFTRNLAWLGSQGRLKIAWRNTEETACARQPKVIIIILKNCEQVVKRQTARAIQGLKSPILEETDSTFSGNPDLSVGVTDDRGDLTRKEAVLVGEQAELPIFIEHSSPVVSPSQTRP